MKNSMAVKSSRKSPSPKVSDACHGPPAESPITTHATPVPVCAWLGLLSMPVLYTAGFLVGMGTVIGWPAYQVFMTERVGRDRLVEANAKIGISDSTAQLVGPGLAGMLIQWLTAPFAILADACAFLVSALLLKGIPPAETDAPKHSGSNVRADIVEGLKAIWTTRRCARSPGRWPCGRCFAMPSSPSSCCSRCATSVSPRGMSVCCS